MPVRRCCYCGTIIPQHQPRRYATTNELINAANYRVSIGAVPLEGVLHICSTHARHKPVTPKKDIEEQNAQQQTNTVAVSEHQSTRHTKWRFVHFVPHY